VGSARPHTSLPARDLLEAASLRVRIRPGAPPVVTIYGELDVYSAPRLHDELLYVVRRHGPRLSLDLRDVTFLDCAGVNLLLTTRRQARLEGGWVRITQASSPARRTISLLGLREVFELGAHRSGDELADQQAGDGGGGGHADGLGDRRQQASAADHAPPDA